MEVADRSEGVADGLEGVIAFASEIAEPDREGGSLRYRGVDIEELVGSLPFERVWGLLVDGHPDRPLEPAGTHPLSFRTGDTRVDVQSAIAALVPEWGFAPLVDVSLEVARSQLARMASMTMSFVAQSARGAGDEPVPQSRIDEGRSLAERFLLRWRGKADPAEVDAIDTYRITAAEHGMNASTFTARVVASTGADVAAAMSAAVGALSGPLHGGAPARVLRMLDEVERGGDAERHVEELLARGDRIMGFGHRVYRAEDPRTGQRIHGLGCSAAEPSSLDRVALTSRRNLSVPRWQRWPSTSPIVCSRRMSSSGPRWCWTTLECRSRCSRHSSYVPERPAGRPTSSNKYGRAG